MFYFICLLNVLKHKYAIDFSLLLAKYSLPTQNDKHESVKSGDCFRVYVHLIFRNYDTNILFRYLRGFSI